MLCKWSTGETRAGNTFRIGVRSSWHTPWRKDVCGQLLSNYSPHPHPSGFNDEEKDLRSISQPLLMCQGNKWSCPSANRSPFLPTWKRENRTASPGSTIRVAGMGGSTEFDSFSPIYTRKIEEQTMNTPFTCLRQEDSPCLSQHTL